MNYLSENGPVFSALDDMMMKMMDDDAAGGTHGEENQLTRIC